MAEMTLEEKAAYAGKVLYIMPGLFTDMVKQGVLTFEESSDIIVKVSRKLADWVTNKSDLTSE